MSKLIQAATESPSCSSRPFLVLKYLFRPWGEPQGAQSLGWEPTVILRCGGPCISKAALTFYRLMAFLAPERQLK